MTDRMKSTDGADAQLPEPPSDDEVRRVARKLGVPDPIAPADEEAAAHPS